MVYDPSAEGAFDGPKPHVVPVSQPGKLVRYTHTSQLRFFQDWINLRQGQSQLRNGANVRLDEDGETIRWYSFYTLPMGCFMVEAKTVLTAEQVRDMLCPVLDWPADDAAFADIFASPVPQIAPGGQTFPDPSLYPSDAEA